MGDVFKFLIRRTANSGQRGLVDSASDRVTRSDPKNMSSNPTRYVRDLYVIAECKKITYKIPRSYINSSYRKKKLGNSDSYRNYALHFKRSPRDVIWTSLGVHKMTSM